MVGHGSAVTTANSTALPPSLGATNSGSPMMLSVARRSEDEADTANRKKEGNREQILFMPPSQKTHCSRQLLTLGFVKLPPYLLVMHTSFPRLEISRKREKGRDPYICTCMHIHVHV